MGGAGIGPAAELAGATALEAGGLAGGEAVGAPLAASGEIGSFSSQGAAALGPERFGASFAPYGPKAASTGPTFAAGSPGVIGTGPLAGPGVGAVPPAAGTPIVSPASSAAKPGILAGLGPEDWLKGGKMLMDLTGGQEEPPPPAPTQAPQYQGPIGPEQGPAAMSEMLYALLFGARRPPTPGVSGRGVFQR